MYCQGSALVWICLHYLRLLPFNVRFRQHAGVSRLRRSVAVNRGDGILTVSAIGIASRLSLRTRLTLIRLALIRKPWSYGEEVFRLLYRYLCLHLLFQTLQHGSIHTFGKAGMLPYQPYFIVRLHDFGTRLMPDYYPRTTARPVSCYALFE